MPDTDPTPLTACLRRMVSRGTEVALPDAEGRDPATFEVVVWRQPCCSVAARAGGLLGVRASTVDEALPRMEYWAETVSADRAATASTRPRI